MRKIKDSEFLNQIYEIVSQIPPGKVATYGQLAFMAGKPACSRQVGWAMYSAPEKLNLPCHRVVNSQGRLAPNWPEQRVLLENEGVAFKENGNVNLSVNLWI